MRVKSRARWSHTATLPVKHTRAHTHSAKSAAVVAAQARPSRHTATCRMWWSSFSSSPSLSVCLSLPLSPSSFLSLCHTLPLFSSIFLSLAHTAAHTLHRYEQHCPDEAAVSKRSRTWIMQVRLHTRVCLPPSFFSFFTFFLSCISLFLHFSSDFYSSFTHLKPISSATTVLSILA